MLHVSFDEPAPQQHHLQVKSKKEEKVLLQQQQPHQQDVIKDDDTGYDIVTLVHENDIEVFTTYGIESWQKYFVYDNNTRIFAICTPVAKVMLDSMI
jgi:hypothetical protein